VDFGQLKTELQLMERNDLATLKAENDRLMADLEKLKQRLREEITRTQAGVRLDLNLEKGELSFWELKSSVLSIYHRAFEGREWSP
jgi:regulator of replication initiation timing